MGIGLDTLELGMEWDVVDVCCSGSCVLSIASLRARPLL